MVLGSFGRFGWKTWRISEGFGMVLGWSCSVYLAICSGLLGTCCFGLDLGN